MDENELICNHWNKVKEMRVFKAKIAYFLFKNELEEKDIHYAFTLCLTHRQHGASYSVATWSISPRFSLYDILRRKKVLEFPTIIVRLLQANERRPQFHEINKYLSNSRKRSFRLEHVVFDPRQHVVQQQQQQQGEGEKEEGEEEEKKEEEEEEVDPAERSRMEKELQSLLSLLT